MSVLCNQFCGAWIREDAYDTEIRQYYIWQEKFNIDIDTHVIAKGRIILLNGT